MPILSTVKGEFCEWNKYQHKNCNDPDNTSDPEIVLHTSLLLGLRVVNVVIIACVLPDAICWFVWSIFWYGQTLINVMISHSPSVKGMQFLVFL